MHTALLILCHQPPAYWAELARLQPDTRLYLHYDAKADIAELAPLRRLPNVHILDTRTDIRWAGYSMVEATFALLRAALADPRNRYFHLLSGNCTLLHPIERIEAEFAQLPDNTLFLESRPTLRLRHRVRFNTPHADTAWQRRLHGKILTKLLQAADLLLPTTQRAHWGSQWFSAARTAAEQLLAAEHDGTGAYFRRKLCPDEHIFQYLLAQRPHAFSHHNDNRRHIRFQGNANHPDWLALPELAQLPAHYWFARKTEQSTALAYLQHHFPKHSTP